MPTIIETADRFRTQLSRLETSATNDLLSAYRGVTNRLEDKITVLLSKFEQLEKQGQLTPENVRKLGTWASLLNQIEDEISKYGGYVDTQNRVAAQKSIDLAGKHSQLLTATYFNDNPSLLKAFNATWDKLPSDQVETLVGFLQQDSQLSINLNNSLGTNAANNFASKLIEGIALGYNPNKINQLINQTLSEPLTWSLNSVRTTQNYTYREATRANYLNNTEIIGSWKWYAALDGRVCLSCVNQHGREFPLNARLNDHHQGRCTQIPILDRPERFGLKTPKIPLGEKWFNGLPETEQRQRMGNDRYTAYKAGKFKFKDLSQEYQNDTFGKMLKEASLKTLLSKAKPSKQPKEQKPKVTLESVVGFEKPKLVNTSSKLDFEKTKSIFSDKINDFKDEFAKQVDHLETKHKLPESIYSVPVVWGGRGDLNGSYSYTEDGKPRKITIFAGEHKHTTLMHEIGHFIDHQALDTPGQFASSSSPILADWRKAIEKTKSFKDLKEKLDNPEKRKVDVGNSYYTISEDQLKYYLEWEELFARSYAQYISIGDMTMQDQMQRQINSSYNVSQWEWDDFKPVEKALDNLFKNLGWK